MRAIGGGGGEGTEQQLYKAHSLAKCSEEKRDVSARWKVQERSRAREHPASSLKLMSCKGYGWMTIKSRPGRCAGPVYKLDTVGDGRVGKTHSVHDRKTMSCEGKREGGPGLQGKSNKEETHNLNLA